jgi:outer membrane protein W
MSSNVRRAAVLAIAVDLILCIGLGHAGETPTAEETPTPAEKKPVSDHRALLLLFRDRARRDPGFPRRRRRAPRHAGRHQRRPRRRRRYNINDYWGFEIQGHGTEPDVRSDTYGKIKEFSNITIVGAARFRYPLGDDRRLVPFVTFGVGGSLNEVNDSGNSRVHLSADRASLVGALALGFDYFLADDVAIGATMHTFIYPNVDTELTIRDQANRIVVHDESSENLTSIAALAHLRVFFGQSDAQPGGRRLFLAEHGPFDTDEIRGYFYLTGGHTELFSDDFAGDVTMAAPGDFNATLGGGLGVNLSKNWGAEIQLVNSEPNINLSGIGKFAEMSNFSVIPMVRFRWPLWGGRLVAFARAGIGVAFNTISDARTDLDQFGINHAVRAPSVDIEGTALASSVAIGAEYFLNRHLSFGVAVPAYIFPDFDTSVRYNSTQRPGGGAYPRGTVNGSTNFSSIGGMLEVKVYLP